MVVDPKEWLRILAVEGGDIARMESNATARQYDQMVDRWTQEAAQALIAAGGTLADVTNISKGTAVTIKNHQDLIQSRSDDLMAAHTRLAL